MTPQHKYRVALFICLLLIGDEFTRARHLNSQLKDHHGKKNKDIKQTPDQDKDKPEDGEQLDGYTTEELNTCIQMEKDLKEARAKISHPLTDQLHRQSLVEEGGGKKGWINPTLVFNVIKIFSNGVGFLVNGIALAHSVQKAIDGCCDFANKEACSYREKYEEVAKNVTALSDTADDLQLKAKLAQMWIEKVTEDYDEILEKLRNIDALENRLIQEISPDVAVATMRAQGKIKELIKEKNETLDGIPFVQVDELFRSTLQSVFDIAGPLLGIAIPGMISIYQYSRYKARMRRLGYIEIEEDVEFKLPKKSSSSKSLHQEAKFKRWTSRQWTKSRIKYQITDIKEAFKRSFKRVKRLASKFSGIFSIVSGLASAGYSIYNMIQIEEECKQTRKKIKCAYIQTKEAEKKIQGQIDSIKNVTAVMMEGWHIVRSSLTYEMLLTSLNETGTMMAGAANQSLAMQSITDDIFGFLTEIKTSDDFNITSDASTKLLMALGKIPFSLKCYTNKINTLNAVISDCKKGDYSINKLIEKSKKVSESLDPNDINDARNCMDSIGFLYIEDDHFKEAWKKVADKEGYHPLCLMNKPLDRENICKKMKEDLLNAEQIAAKSINWDRDDVQEVMDLLNTLFSPGERRSICRNKCRYKHPKDKKKLEERLKMIFPNYKLKDLLDVNCTAPDSNGSETCIPDEAFSTKQLEREKLESGYK